MTRNGLRAERARERFEEELRQEFKRTQQQQHTKASSDPHTPVGPPTDGVVADKEHAIGIRNAAGLVGDGRVQRDPRVALPAMTRNGLFVCMYV